MTAKYVYFFKGPNYARYNARTDTLEPSFTRRITETWNRWPVSFASGVDAAVNWGDGSVYFFKGPRYIRYDIAADRVPDVVPPDPPFPRKIIDFWNGWPASFASGVDAAVNWGDGTAFFFKGPQYLKYDIGHDRVASVVPPYPLDIAPDQWPALVPVGFTSGIGTALEWPYAEIASIKVPANRSGCTETFFSVTESFDMNVDFASAPYPAACWCGEYRQFVRGTIFHNGRAFNHAMPDPADGTRPLLPRPAPGTPGDNFQEDGIPASTSSTAFFYGHRGSASGNSEFNDRYLPDRKDGCQYRGHDSPNPGKDTFGGPAEFDVDFRGQVIDLANGNEVIATKDWRVNCRRP